MNQNEYRKQEEENFVISLNGRSCLIHDITNDNKKNGKNNNEKTRIDNGGNIFGRVGEEFGKRGMSHVVVIGSVVVVGICL